MQIKAVKTRPFTPPRDDLFSLLRETFGDGKLKEKSIIVITSKIVSIGEGKCILKEEAEKKDELIAREADFFIERERIPKRRVMLTLKDNLLVPTAGIDESNGKGYFILWPKNPKKSAINIYNFIKKEYGLRDFGIIITDSRCVPSRRGTVGFALAYTGFNPLNDYRHKKDIFGRRYKMTQANLVDSLASAAVLVIGEGGEQTPIAIIEDIDFISFEEPKPPEEKDPLILDKEEDFYAPLIKGVKWRKGGGGIQ